MINPEREARKQRRMTVMAGFMSQKQNQHEGLKKMAVSAEFKALIAGTALESPEALESLKLIMAKDLEPILEKRIRAEMDLLMEAKLDQAAQLIKKSAGKKAAEQMKEVFRGKSKLDSLLTEGIPESNEWMESSCSSSSFSDQSNQSRRKARPSVAKSVKNKKHHLQIDVNRDDSDESQQSR